MTAQLPSQIGRAKTLLGRELNKMHDSYAVIKEHCTTINNPERRQILAELKNVLEMLDFQLDSRT